MTFQRWYWTPNVSVAPDGNRVTGQLRLAVALLSLFLVVCFALPAFAQSQPIEGVLTLPTEVRIDGKGWSQIFNAKEMMQFSLGVVETLVFTTLLAFHPQNREHVQGRRNWRVPRALFLYGLIGMLVGFLVVHHGYLIGFVVFGVGGLFRFRMETMSISNTAQLILVSLIGLTIGLDLPIMAALAVVAGWIVLWVFGGRQDMVLEVKFNEDLNYAQALDGLKKSLSEKGFVCVTVTKPKFKSMAEITLAAKARDGRGNLVAHLSAMQSDEAFGIVDWHLE
ncbi:MAG: hypothetical protein ACSHXD_19015 [Marinosulfonomonas sp.]